MLRVSQLSHAMTALTALRILSLDKEAVVTHSSIKKAYVQQTLLCHPDLHPNDPEANNKFRTLAEALRTALTTLRLSKPTRKSVCAGQSSHDTLDALRSAVTKYQKHKRELLSVYPHLRCARAEAHDGVNSEAKVFCSGSTDDASFGFPSLEYVSSVCRREALALRRVQLFCEQLPSVLCGSTAPPLFETVAFFPHYFVESTAECVVRFSRNVPLIVRRVVHNRSQHIRNVHNKANQGIGTDTRYTDKSHNHSHIHEKKTEQRIEDILFKPLVLMGALIFTTPGAKEHECEAERQHERAADRDKHHPKYCSKSERSRNTRASSSSTMHSNIPGVNSTDDICIADELTCVLHSTDSMKEMVDKIGRWEAASFTRLKLELALVNVAELVASVLGLTHCKRVFAITTNLELTSNHVKDNLTLLQKLASQLCYYYGKSSQGSDVDRHKVDLNSLLNLSMPSLMRLCRQLGSRVGSVIRGSILLTPMSDKDRIHQPDGFLSCPPPHLHDSEAEVLHILSLPIEQSELDHFGVTRHSSCSTAEDIGFTVTVRLTCSARVLLLRLVRALYAVCEALERTQKCLTELVALRDAVANEEFVASEETDDSHRIALLTDSIRSSSTTTTIPTRWTAAAERQLDEPDTSHTQTDTDECNFSSTHNTSMEMNRGYSYRAPIHCFVRVYNMSIEKELLFWKQLYSCRTFAAFHCKDVHPINLYHNKLTNKQNSSSVEVGGAPADTTGESESADSAKECLTGWIEHDKDGYDCSVISDTELNDELAFRAWLQEVLTQSTLNKQAHDTLRLAGINYVTRDPELPVHHFFRFVEVFVRASAVRSVIEHRPPQSIQPATLMSSEDVGLQIVVSAYCDLCAGGKLYIAWHTDPSILITLLTSNSCQAKLHASTQNASLLPHSSRQ